MQQVAKRHSASKYGAVTASKIVGEPVVNRHNEDLGKIHELVIDPKEGHVAYAVLASGGFPGMGNRLLTLLESVRFPGPGPRRVRSCGPDERHIRSVLGRLSR